MFVKTTLQIGLIGPGIYDRCRTESGLLFGSQLYPNLLGYGVRHLALQLEDISQVTLIGFRPEMLVGPCLDELGNDSYAVVRTHNGSFDNSIGVQLLRNFWQRFV